MRNSSTQMAFFLLVLLCTFSMSSAMLSFGTGKAKDAVKAKKEDVKRHYDDSKLRAANRHSRNPAFLRAGLEGAKQSKQDYRQHVKEGSYSKAAADVLNVVKRPVKGVLLYGESQIVDAGSLVKNSKLGRMVRPSIKTQAKLDEKNHKIQGKDVVRSTVRLSQMQKLSGRSSSSSSASALSSDRTSAFPSASPSPRQHGAGQYMSSGSPVTKAPSSSKHAPIEYEPTNPFLSPPPSPHAQRGHARSASSSSSSSRHLSDSFITMELHKDQRNVDPLERLFGGTQ